MPPEIVEWIPPAVIIALMIYLHRSTHRRLDRLETQVGDLRDRMGRVEGRSRRYETSSSATDAAPPRDLPSC